MSRCGKQRSKPVPAGSPTPSPSVKRKASELLNRMSAFDGAGEHPIALVARAQIREDAAALGMRMVSFTVTEDPLPDADLDALPDADYDRIGQISRDLYTRPGDHVTELESLVAKYPHIPLLRNHLVCALEAKQQRKRAEQLTGELARAFPLYVFGYSNHVLHLLAAGKVDEARVLVESGPRGPLFALTEFDTSREVFHITEVISHASMVGHYLLATDRLDAAEVQLRALKSLAPKSLQTKSLDEAVKQRKERSVILEAMRRLLEGSKKQAAKRREKAETKAAKKTAPTDEKRADLTVRIAAGLKQKSSANTGPTLFESRQ